MPRSSSACRDRRRTAVAGRPRGARRPRSERRCWRAGGPRPPDRHPPPAERVRSPRFRWRTRRRGATPSQRANSSSKRSTSCPRMNQPLARTRETAASMAGRFCSVVLLEGSERDLGSDPGRRRAHSVSLTPPSSRAIAPAAGAGGLRSVLEADPVPAPADVAVDLGRASVDQGEVGNVPRQQRPGAHHGVASDRDAGQEDRARAQARAGAHQRARVRVEVLAAAGPQVVGEGDVGTHEHVVFQHEPVVEGDAALDGDPVAQHDVVLDEAPVADVAVLPDAGALEDVDEGPDAGAVADLPSRRREPWDGSRSSTATSLTETGRGSQK